MDRQNEFYHGDGLRVRFSGFLPRRRSNADTTPLEGPWPVFAGWLVAPVVSTNKAEQAFATKVWITNGKGGRSTSPNGNLLVFEFDKPPPGAKNQQVFEQCCDVLASYCAVLYTSASATADDWRFRGVLLASRAPANAAEYRACIEHLAQLIGFTPASESFRDSQLWYRPITGGPGSWIGAIERFDGPNVVDVDEAVRLHPPRKKGRPRKVRPIRSRLYRRTSASRWHGARSRRDVASARLSWRNGVSTTASVTTTRSS